MAFGAFGLLFAEKQQLELVFTFLTDVLENGHETNSAEEVATSI